MAFCGHCGSQVGDEFRFCPSCGRERPTTAQETGEHYGEGWPPPPEPTNQPLYPATEQRFSPVAQQQYVPPTNEPQVPTARVSEPRNALGVAALILGIVGLMFGFMPITGFVACGLGVTGLILALAARGRLRRRTATNRKTTIAGGVVSLAAIALGEHGSLPTRACHVATLTRPFG